MKNKINKLIVDLKSYQSTLNVFNQWRDYDEEYDISPKAPSIRLKQLEMFLHGRIPNAKYLLVAEATGYQGGKFTGVPLTSERILLDNHSKIRSSSILKNIEVMRTSNPNSSKIKEIQRRLGFTEPTATIVWGEIIKSNVSSYEILTWNTFPFHPFNQNRGSLSNRTPKLEELEIGSQYIKKLVKLCPNITVVSIGAHSARTLNKLGIQNIQVTHPANGGARKFREAIKNVLV